jgi:hypothetical protein
MNPYESPTAMECSEQRPWQHRAVLALVLVTMVVNVRQAAQNASQLTIAHHLFSVFLWGVLPSLAAWLIWRGRSAGRWLLVGLFGLRAAVCLRVLLLALDAQIVASRTALLIREPYFSYVLDVIVFGGATGWLLLSPGFRRRKGVIP